MTELKNSVKSAIDTVADRAKNATDWVADRTESVGERAGELATDAARSVANKATKAKDWVADATMPASGYCAEATADTKAAVQRLGNDVTEVVRHYPLAAIAVCFGLGLLLGRSANRA